MAKPSWISLSRSEGTGGGSVNVTASKNSNTGTRSGTLTVKTASGLTKTVSVSQEGVPQITVNFTGGFKFYTSTDVSFTLGRYVYFREGSGSGQFEVLQNGPVQISAGNYFTAGNTSSLRLPDGSIFMGFQFVFNSYASGEIPSNIQHTASTFSIGSVSVQTSNVNQRIIPNAGVVISTSHLTLADDDTVDTSNLLFNLS